MDPSTDGYTNIDIDIEDSDLAILVEGGLLQLREDGAYDLTAKGIEWFDDWIKEKLGDQVPTEG